VQADIDHGSRGEAEVCTVLGVALGRGEKTELVGQVGGVARPTFSQRSTAQHGDAGGAIGSSDAANAGWGTGGKPVLDVVAEAAVVHHMVELDGGIISARRYKVVDGRGVVHRCRRPIG
jgi:hypothetical protein